MEIQVKNLHHLMKRHSLSKAELARKLDVTRGTVSNWFTRGKIPPKNVGKLSVLLDVPIEELVEGSTPTSYEVSQIVKILYCLSPRSQAAVLNNAQALLDAESSAKFTATDKDLPHTISTSLGIARRRTL